MTDVVEIPTNEIVVVEGNDSEEIIVPSSEIELIEAAVAGPPGAQGEQGPPGIQGPPGPGADHFRYVQSIPASVWTIDHNLGRIPAVTVVDSAGNEVFGDVVHPTQQQAVITFSVEFAGDAYLT